MAAPTKATNTLNYFSDSDILVPPIIKGSLNSLLFTIINPKPYPPTVITNTVSVDVSES